MNNTVLKKLVMIPAYNEAENILDVVNEVRDTAPEFDYIVINDCSTDKTYELCAKNGINVVNLPINLGIGGAVQTGYKYAYLNGYDYAVQLDGDGQHDPVYLGKMLDLAVSENADMVIGSRFIEKEGFQSTTARRFGIRFFTFLIRLLTGKTITDPTSGLRLVNRGIIEKFALDYPRDYPEPESVTDVLRRGGRVVELPVQMRARGGGSSSIGALASLYYVVKVTFAILLSALPSLRRS